MVFILIGATVFQPRVPGRRRPEVGRAPADRAAGRPARLPDRRQHPRLPARLLPRLLRTGLHHRPARRAGGRQARHRPGLVRRAGVNMQTSFMHPPFGFALFYLRSVAPHEDYVDKVTGKPIKKVTIEQIYWGSVPFVIIQIVMVATIIAFPASWRGTTDKARRSMSIEALEQMRNEPKAEPPSLEVGNLGLGSAASEGDRCRRRQGRPDEGGARVAEERAEEVGRQAQSKSPAAAGSFVCRDTRRAPRRAGGQSFCACMKSSKAASAKRHHRLASRRSWHSPRRSSSKPDWSRSVRRRPSART